MMNNFIAGNKVYLKKMNIKKTPNNLFQRSAKSARPLKSALCSRIMITENDIKALRLYETRSGKIANVKVKRWF